MKTVASQRKNSRSVKGKHMLLETERLILRRFRQGDFADFCEVVMDSERNRMMGNDDVSSADDARVLFDWFMEKEPRAYAIVLKKTDRVVGNLTVYDEPPEEIKMRPELTGKIGRSLSFSLSRAYRHQGLIFEVVSTVIQYLFQAENVDYIHSGYLDFNAPSERLHKKLGFTYLTTQYLRCEENGERFTGIENILWRDG